MRKAHRYNLGIIGNCNYLAYIRDDSAVQWMCWPTMESSFVFGSLLDENKGGTFQVIPETKFTTSQRYIENTAIISTHFYCEDGEFEVIDFAPRFNHFNRQHRPLQFFRKIKRVVGQPKIKVICHPTGSYGEQTPQCFAGSNHISYRGLHLPLRLTTNASKTYLLEQRSFLLTQDLFLVLSGGEPFDAPLKETYEEFFYKTMTYWRRWVKDTYIPNIFQKELIRSAITIKIHQYEDTGAIIASGTTSLPEYPNSGRNWDYRYCWLRDSYFSLSALNSMGHFEEAEHYLQFIHNILVKDVSKLQPMYRINGEGEIMEFELDLEGFMGNRPVRIGNAAYYQKQFDAFGQVILSLLPLYTDERIIHREHVINVDLIEKLLNEIEKVMDEPDSGTWELRGRKAKHLGTYIFHWAGAKASYKIAENNNIGHLKEYARKIIKLSEENIEACYSEEFECYMADQSREHFDATGFLLIIMNYLSHEDTRTHKHFQRLQKELLSPEGLIYRYRNQDDFGDTHACFLICCYWYIESLICLGFLKEAEDSLRNIIQHANHLGLLSEDLSSEDGGQWGNFPQTYSHVGLINAVCRLARKRDRMVFE
jgi:GH15 family glucan-1,4-alpha-glucosidase